MSYQVLARKWRPQTFDELIGQEAITQTLMNALRSDRLPHALLFTGPRGTGKTSLARILAKSLRCPHAQAFLPCNDCPECSDISASRCLDVFEMDGASNNGVDAIRELRENIKHMATSGKYKLYVIDEVHMLSISAFNALLKTLEEPPSHVLFVLATTEVQKIPDTILSRCQRFDFRRIPHQKILQQLKKICDSEKIQAQQSALWMIARHSDGSMRDSQSLLDQVISFSHNVTPLNTKDLTIVDVTIDIDKVIGVLGLTDRHLLQKCMAAIVHKDPDQALDVIKKIYHAGQQPRAFVQELLQMVRDLLLIKLNPSEAAQIVNLPTEEIEALSNLAQSVDLNQTHSLFDIALQGSQEVIRAQDPSLVLEMILLKMVNRHHLNGPTTQQAADRIQSAAPASSVTTPASSAAPASAAPSPVLSRHLHPAPPTATTATNPASVAEAAASSHIIPTPAPSTSWSGLIESLKGRHPRIHAILFHTFVAAHDAESLTIGLPKKYEFLYDQLNDPSSLATVTSSVESFYKKKLKIKIAIKDVRDVSKHSTPQDLLEQQTALKQKELVQQVESHPFVQQIKKNLNTKIKSIKEL